MNFKQTLHSCLIFPLGLLGGILGALSGADQSSKVYRRIFIPLLLTLESLMYLLSFWSVSIMTMAGVLSMGYGIPDPGWPEDSHADEGSDMGRFWFRVFRGNHFWADIFTRSTIGILLCITCLSIPILTGAWGRYLMCSGMIVLVYATISWRGLGTFTFQKKQLCWSEFILYTTVMTCVSLMIPR